MNFFNNQEEQRRKAKELADSLNFSSAANTYRNSSTVNSDYHKFEAEQKLLSFHDASTSEKYRELKLSSTFAAASGNKTMADMYLFEAEKLLTTMPTKKF